MFSRWRITEDLDQSRVKVSYAELVSSNIFLIVGAIVLGYGLASFDFMAVGLAISITGGVLLLAGIALTVRSIVVITNALHSAANALQKLVESLSLRWRYSRRACQAKA